MTDHAPDAGTDTAAGRRPILLIHGLWMTPRSWDTWASRYREAGHEVIVPGWPGVGERSPEDIRRDPSSLRGVGIAQIVDHYERIARALPVAPIVMGHSFGGLFAQMLADRGAGAAFVGVTPGQPAGVTTLPASTVRTAFPVLRNPFGRNGASPISKAHFHFTFGNDLSRAESDAIWEEQAINSVNRVFFEGVAGAFAARTGASHVDYGKPDRAPLLLIGGERDHVVPPAIVRAIAAKYDKASAGALVETRILPGRTHRIVSQDGWEEVADAALAWARVNAPLAG